MEESTRLAYKSGHYITSIVEIIAGGVVFWLTHKYQLSLDMLLTSTGTLVLISSVELIFLFAIIKSFFGKVVFTIDKYKLDYFIGVFNIGKTNSIPLDKLREVFVQSNSSRGGSDSDGTYTPNSKSWKIIIRTNNKNFEILANSTTEAKLGQICESLNTEINKYRSKQAV